MSTFANRIPSPVCTNQETAFNLICFLPQHSCLNAYDLFAFHAFINMSTKNGGGGPADAPLCFAVLRYYHWWRYGIVNCDVLMIISRATYYVTEGENIKCASRRPFRRFTRTILMCFLLPKVTSNDGTSSYRKNLGGVKVCAPVYCGCGMLFLIKCAIQ